MVKLKTTLLILFLTVLSNNIYAQNDSLIKPMRGYIGITLGPSFPMAVIAKNSLGNLKGSRGLEMNLIDAGYYFTDHFGVAFKWEGNAFDFDVTDLSYYINRAHPYGFYLTPGTWTQGAIMGGIRLAKTDRKVTESFGLFVGLLNAQTPDIVFYNDSIRSSTTTKPGESTSLAAEADLHFNCHIGKRLDFIFGLAYLFAKPHYDFDLNVYRTGYKDEGKFTQEISTLNTSIGLAYRFR